MTDRGILFSAPMVLALLDDRKTQTRRGIKPQPDWLPEVHSTRRTDTLFWPISGNPGHQCGAPLTRCPYGVPGDVLWVRETLKRAPHLWTYAADGAEVGWPARQALAGKARDTIVSIHMPRDACRMRLRITDVRVERLNDISAADSLAEGVECATCTAMGTSACLGGGCFASLAAYRQLWEHINGPGSWAANPWTWAVSFERVRS